MEALFWTLVLFSQVLGVVSVILLATWLSEYGGGYDWDCGNGVGSYHYLLLTIGMVFLYAEAMISFRVTHRLGLSYTAEKAIHATIQSIVVVLVGIGVHAAFVCKDTQGPEKAGKDLYSLHSWLGLATIIVFFGQWIYGIVMTVALRKLDRSWQDLLLPNHAFFGILIFAMSICSCLTGVNEMAIFFVENYNQIVPSGHLANAFGLCLIAFAAVTAYVAYKPDFQIPENRRHPECNAVPTSEGIATSGSGKVVTNPTEHAHQKYGATEETAFKEMDERETKEV
ncbi:cytochrome b561 [Strongylocentrotus purpuratus]|uniref:Cytochrome b561 domain-containing protein n=1 Tax=Strongylocentrotus purpuratus TaxID=7668 RepID=A0A7M7N4H1_STRPU|nr:cytochrome b561 [Strongylocentrotus purpuratus]XP_030830353.1 cytochrome b561 [Strongylocentrotus purpuratus]